VKPKRKLTASPVRKRSARVGRHKTGLSVEEKFWQGLKEIARERELPLNRLVAEIDAGRQYPNLSSAIRLFVLDHYVTLAKQKTTNDRPT
jgi:predicted DNA-binding ribbon-helix-helix protein